MNPSTMELSADQSLLFARFAEAAVGVVDPASFQHLIAHHVQPLLPHGMPLAVIGQLSFDHLTVLQHITVNYPEWALALVTQPINIRERPVLQRWLHTRLPVVVGGQGSDDALMSERERQEAQAIGMGRFAAYGLPDLTSRMGSYFSFAQIPPEMDHATLVQRLRVMMPLLHVALVQACSRQAEPETKTSTLTAIEKELLGWLAAGRTNQEIAAMRQRSPDTVRNQLIKLYAKLGVATRAEAVSLMLSESLKVPDPKPGA